MPNSLDPSASASPARSWLRTFAALGNRNYRLFWIGQSVSLVGTWAQNAALSWLVLTRTQSPLVLGAVSTAQFAPVLLLSLFGGVIADRLPKRRLLLMTQAVMMLVAFGLAIASSTHHASLPIIFTLVALSGTANALDNPTRQAFVSEMVGPSQLANAIALNSSQFQLSRLVGPPLAGWLVAMVGFSACFYLNAGSFVAVIVGLALIRSDRLFPAQSPSHAPMTTQVREGLRYVAGAPDLAFILLMVAVLGTFGYNFQVFVPLIAHDRLHTGALGFGVLSAAMPLGSLVASLALAYAGTATRRQVIVGGAAFSVLLAAVGLSRWWSASMLLFFALGFASTVFQATSNSRLQLLSEPSLRGRVMSIYTMLFLGSTPIGSLVVGVMAEHAGVPLTMVAMAAICAAGTAGGWMYLRKQRGHLSSV